MRTLLAAALVGLAAVGCSKSHAQPASTPAVAVPSVAASHDDALALALAPLSGSSSADRAVSRLQASAQKNPQKVDLWILLGRAWIKKARESADPGFYAHADACAKVALEREPENLLALDLSAMVLLNGHEFEAARAVAQSIVDRRPDDPAAYGTLSDALLELGRFDEAAAAVQTMVDLKPNLPAYSRAAHIRWLQGDVPGAKAILRHAMDAGDARDPEPLAWVLVQAAQLFWNEGDYEGADAGYDRALATFSEFAPALVGKGQVALARGDAAGAVGYLERAYEASPLARTAWLLGDARAAAGDAKGSAEAYALTVREGRSDGRTLAEFLATKGRDAAEAVRLAREERRVRGGVYTDDALAWALYRKGDLAAAREASDRATALGTRDARLLYHAGAIRIAMGDAEAGRELVQRALALNPHFDVTGAAEAGRL